MEKSIGVKENRQESVRKEIKIDTKKSVAGGSVNGGVKSAVRGDAQSSAEKWFHQLFCGVTHHLTAPIGRRGFIEGYFGLSFLALSLFALFLYHYAGVIESPQRLLRGITALILERNFYLVVVMLFFLSFGYLYLLRVRGSNLSATLRRLSLLPLILFYLAAMELILTLTNTIVETNFLQMIAAIKRFSESPNGDHFAHIVPANWILLLEKGAWRFQLLATLHLLMLIFPLLLPTIDSPQERWRPIFMRGFFALCGKMIHYLFFLLALLWWLLSLLVWGYLTYQTFQIESGIRYLQDYQLFQSLFY
ncbi:hypothetical protein [Ignatzschineria cameli]|uniref:hypothetical protein n=1 Tax=Ignatzschineria cameli TaxID=2182793 RepID=UPI000D605242|nr:hypothetical protein [Ignatzschineria cameli]PWD86632.1 hypothetical protein DC080_03115 [Ignatzschineria cameli]